MLQDVQPECQQKGRTLKSVNPFYRDKLYYKQMNEGLDRVEKIQWNLIDKQTRHFEDNDPFFTNVYQVLDQNLKSMGIKAFGDLGGDEVVQETQMKLISNSEPNSGSFNDL